MRYLLSIAVLGLVVLSAFTSSLEYHLATLHLSPAVRHLIEVPRIKLAGITFPTNVSSGTQVALKGAINESFVSIFRLVVG